MRDTSPFRQAPWVLDKDPFTAKWVGAVLFAVTVKVTAIDTVTIAILLLFSVIDTVAVEGGSL